MFILYVSLVSLPVFSAGVSFLYLHFRLEQEITVPFFRIFLTSKLSQFGHFSPVGSFHNTKSQSGYLSQPKNTVPRFDFLSTIVPFSAFRTSNSCRFSKWFAMFAFFI